MILKQKQSKRQTQRKQGRERRRIALELLCIYKAYIITTFPQKYTNMNSFLLLYFYLTIILGILKGIFASNTLFLTLLDDMYYMKEEEWNKIEGSISMKITVKCALPSERAKCTFGEPHSKT